MRDWEVQVTAVISGVLWLAGAATIVAGVLTKAYGVPAVGLFSAGVAAVLNIRGLVLGMEQRIRNAFELGRDYERSQPPIRSVR